MSFMSCAVTTVCGRQIASQSNCTHGIICRRRGQQKHLGGAIVNGNPPDSLSPNRWAGRSLGLIYMEPAKGSS